MQSKTSFFNKTIFKKNLTRFWPFSLLYTAFLLLIHPFVLYLNTQSVSMQHYSDAERRSAIYQMICDSFENLTEPVSIAIITIVIAIAMFGYLYQSRSANMLHAFPVSRNELFITNYVSGLVLMAVPQLVCAIFMNFTILGHANKAVWAVWVWLAITIGETLFFYGFSCFVVMFTGQLPVAPLFYFIWNFLYLGVIGLIDVLAASFLYGISDQLIPLDVNPFTPVVYLMKKVGFSSSPALTADGILLSTRGIGTLFIYVGVGAVLTIAAWYVYKKRRVETAGEFISIGWAKPLFRWGCAIVLSVAATEFVFFVLAVNVINRRSIEVEFAIGLVLFTAIFFLAAQMFIERSFKVFNKKVLRECAICVASVVVAFILFGADVFGIEKHVPDAGRVASVSINGITLTDPDNIKQTVNAHQMMVDNRRELKRSITTAEDPWEDENYYFLNLKYELKNGRMLSRRYTFILNPDDEVQAAMRVFDQMAADPEGIKMALFGDDYAKHSWRVEGANLSYAANWVNEGSEDAWLQYEDASVLGSEEDLKELYQALLTDIDNGALRLRYSINYRSIKAAEGVAGYSASLELNLVSEDERYRHAWIDLDTKCQETIKCLVKAGVIASADDLFISE